jgi:hypothetical protein
MAESRGVYKEVKINIPIKPADSPSAPTFDTRSHEIPMPEFTHSARITAQPGLGPAFPVGCVV